MKLEELKATRESIKARIFGLQDDLKEVEKAMVEKLTTIRAGDVISHGKDRKTHYSVIRIALFADDGVCIFAKKLRKDGSPVLRCRATSFYSLDSIIIERKGGTVPF